MRNECKIVEDLLPVYLDDLCQEETAEFVAGHISGCESCSEKYRAMKKPIPEEKVDKKKISAQKKPLKKVVVSTIMKTLACVCSFMIIATVVLRIVEYNTYRLYGPTRYLLPFYTMETVDGKKVKKYVENGELMERLEGGIDLEFVNCFQYKGYYIFVESPNGARARTYGKEILDNDVLMDKVADGKAYVLVRDISTDRKIPFEELSYTEQKAIEKPAAALAYVEEAVTDYAIKEFRDVYTESAGVHCDIKSFEVNVDYIRGNKAFLDGNTQKILFSGGVAGADHKNISVNDVLTFDMTGWQDGKLPTYTAEKRRDRYSGEFYLEEAIKELDGWFDKQHLDEYYEEKNNAGM